MSCNKQILFHVGLPKAASSTVSQLVFLNNPEINYLSKHSRDNHLINYIKHTILTLDHKYFMKKLGKAREKFLELSLEVDRPNVLSESGMCNKDFMENFQRLALVTEGMKDRLEFLIIIRSQPSAIISSINHVGHLFSEMETQGEENVENFLGLLINHGLNSKKTPTYFKSFDYQYLFDLIEQLFPNSKMHVLLFEQLQDDKELFQEKLREILKIKNVSIDGALNVSKKSEKEETYYPSTPFFPVLSKLLKNPFLFSFVISGTRRRSFLTFNKRILSYLKYSPEMQTHISNQQKKLIKSAYEESNRFVSKKFKLELDKYGYY